MSDPSSPQMNVKEFLRPILFGLAEEDLDELAQAAVERSFSPGDVICRDGEPGEVVYFIVQGRVEIVKPIDEDTERHLHDIGPGEIFGEMALFQAGVRAATVRAAEPTIVLEIGRDPFLAVLGRSPSLGVRILVRLTSRLRDSDQKAIVELSKANEELTRALRKLEQMDRTKSDFIQVSAHELRTPVAAMMGYAQMMQGDPTVQQSPQLRALVDGIVVATERLHRVFNSILDVSRLMAGDTPITRSLVSIAVLFEGIRSVFQQALEERRLALECVGLHALPLYSGESESLYKAFYQLVNNAVKYTPDGGRITATGQVLETPDLGRCIEVAVQDTGIGIAPQDLDLIFEKFYRTGEVALHSSGTTKFKGGGPGLGLAIAQGVVVAHGGRLWAESPGRDEVACPGSRFVVQLPL
jgi:signal transduction histidine kinase